MPAKTMIVTYNQIQGVPVGRCEKGNVVGYSAEWGFEELALDLLLAPSFLQEALEKNIQRTAEATMSSLQEMLVIDLKTVETVYVYVGMNAMDGAMNFIEKLQKMGKQVHMIACDCDSRIKADFARKLGIDVIWTSCGGDAKCGEIFAQHAA